MYITIHATGNPHDSTRIHSVNTDKVLLVVKDNEHSILQIQDYGILYAEESYDEVMKLLSE